MGSLAGGSAGGTALCDFVICRNRHTTLTLLGTLVNGLVLVLGNGHAVVGNESFFIFEVTFGLAFPLIYRAGRTPHHRRRFLLTSYTGKWGIMRISIFTVRPRTSHWRMAWTLRVGWR